MSLVQTDYGLIYSTNGSLCATLRPGEGRSGGAVAVEEGTTNLLTTRTAPAQEVVAVSKGQKYTLSAYGNGNAMVYQQHVDDTQADWQQGTLDGVVATSSGSLKLLQALVRIDEFSSDSSSSYVVNGNVSASWDTANSRLVIGSGAQTGGVAYNAPFGLGVYHFRVLIASDRGDGRASDDIHISIASSQPTNIANGSVDGFTIVLRVPEQVVELAPALTGAKNQLASFAVSLDQWYTVTVRWDDGRLRVWIDDPEMTGQPLIDYTYSTGLRTTGYAGWGVSNSRVYVDWFDVFCYVNTGSRTSPILDLSPVGTAAGSSISWTATTPEGTSVTVETNLSLDDGQTWQGWQQVTNGGPIPGISTGTGLSNARLQTRVTLQTTDPTVTPRVDSLTVEVGHQAVAVVAESLSQSSPLTFTAVGNRVRLVPSAGVTKWQLERKPFATSFVDQTRTAGRLVYPTSVFNPAQGTISMWVRKHQLINYNARVFWSETGSYRFGIHDVPNGGLRWAYVNPNDGQTSGGFLTPGTWNHLVMTWHRDEGWMRGYLDGEPVASLTFDPGTDPGFVYSNTWGLGATVDGSQVFNGLIDELLILPYAADEQEIQSWYQNGITHVRKPGYYASFDDSLALQYWSEVTYDYRVQNNRVIFTEAPKPEDHVLAFYEAAD